MAEFAALLPFADRFAAANAPACYRPGVPEDAYTERWLIANADHIYVPFETISDAKVVYNFNDGPNDRGVYFLFDGDELQYVGQAKGHLSQTSAAQIPVAAGSDAEPLVHALLGNLGAT